ncbi:unnamed protein product [Symbiodinium microadriaticum]|nr:unnamed protein product [Symbiodinium microadriaticum]
MSAAAGAMEDFQGTAPAESIWDVTLTCLKHVPQDRASKKEKKKKDKKTQRSCASCSEIRAHFDFEVMSAQPFTTGQEATTSQVNGFVRPQEGESSSGNADRGEFLGSAVNSLQTAVLPDVDQGRVHGVGAEVPVVGETSVQVETAAEAPGEGERVAMDSAIFGPPPQEAQAGVQIGHQVPANAVGLAGQVAGADLPMAGAVNGGAGGVGTDFHTPRSTMGSQMAGFATSRGGRRLVPVEDRLISMRERIQLWRSRLKSKGRWVASLIGYPKWKTIMPDFRESCLKKEASRQQRARVRCILIKYLLVIPLFFERLLEEPEVIMEKAKEHQRGEARHGARSGKGLQPSSLLGLLPILQPSCQLRRLLRSQGVMKQESLQPWVLVDLKALSKGDAEGESPEVVKTAVTTLPTLGLSYQVREAIANEIDGDRGSFSKGWGGQPVLSWEALLQAAAKVAGVPPEAKAPSLNVLAIRAGGTDGASDVGAYALVDSGATHPLRRAADLNEWAAASPVVVHLAGGEVVELRMNHPQGLQGDVLNLRVKDGCPEITEQQALSLIARIEDKKLEGLRVATEETRTRIREAAISLIKTWFDHMIAYCRSGIAAEAQFAIRQAPFFEDLPPEVLYGLCEADPIDNGWEALEGLRHLNRGFAVLELDVEQGKTHNMYDPLTWRALEWGARMGSPEALRSPDYLYGGRVQLDAFPPVRSPPSVWTKEFSEQVAIAIREQRLAPRMLKMSAEQWKEHVRNGHLLFRSDCMTCVTAGATGRRQSRVEHPTCFVLSADVSGPLKIPGLDPDARGAFPKPHKYMFVAKLRIPRTFVDDGRGVGLEYDPGEPEADITPEEEAFDFVDPAPEADKPVVASQEDEEDLHPAEEDDEGGAPEGRLSPEDDLDSTGPDTVNLIFATALTDNKGSTVLEAIQDVVTYCWALNIPILRFHCDRGMEFYAKATRQWIKFHGMRLIFRVPPADDFAKRSTYDLPWVAELFVRAIRERRRWRSGCGGGGAQQWNMFFPLSEGEPQTVPKVMIASCDGVPTIAKTEVTYTKNIEALLESLDGPLTVVHTVDPSEASECFHKCEAAALKELKSFDAAAKKVQSTDPDVVQELKCGKAKLVPMKIVYTVKPPSEEAMLKGELFRRKVRIVACGNMVADTGEETYAGAAPAEVVRSSLSVSSLRGWDAAVLDVTAAFLQTPLSEVQCRQRIFGQPPRVLARSGLCHHLELWEFTHAVYGLRESPRCWGEFRDTRLAQLNIIVDGKRIKLLQCRVEGDEDETIFSVEELRAAQQLAGEVLWLSQRTRRAVDVATKRLQYLQGTMSYSIRVNTRQQRIEGVETSLSKSLDAATPVSISESTSILEILDESLWKPEWLEDFKSVLASKTGVDAADMPSRAVQQDYILLPKYLTADLWEGLLQPEGHPRERMLEQLCKHAARLGLRNPSEASNAIILALVYGLTSKPELSVHDMADLLKTKRGVIKKFLQAAGKCALHLTVLPKDFVDLPSEFAQLAFADKKPAAAQREAQLESMMAMWPLRGTNKVLQKGSSSLALGGSGAVSSQMSGSDMGQFAASFATTFLATQANMQPAPAAS